MSSKINMSFLFTLGLAFLHVATSQTMQKVCNEDDISVCFQQLTDPNTNTTIGIVLPPAPTFPGKADAVNLGEAIYKVSTPLPYGFAGFAFSLDSSKRDSTDTITPPQNVMTVLITPITTNGAIGVSERICIAQNSILSPDGTSYIPSTEGNLLVSLSAEATYADNSQVTLVFRCQNCPVAFKPGSSLIIMRSEESPIYPAPAATNATLPLKGAVFSRVEIPDESVLRSDQFSAYVKSLNV